MDIHPYELNELSPGASPLYSLNSFISYPRSPSKQSIPAAGRQSLLAFKALPHIPAPTPPDGQDPEVMPSPAVESRACSDIYETIRTANQIQRGNASPALHRTD
jgi:hypothetical protein